MADPRDEIWTAVYEVWYDAECNAELSDRLVSRWQGFDDVTKVVVALTATSSVVAGWTLWSSSGELKTIWVVVAGIGAVLSIVSSALGVPERLKSWSQSKSEFRALAIGFQALRLDMRVDPQFDVQKVKASFEDLHRRYGETVGRMRNDFLATNSLRQSSQDAITSIVSREQR